MDKILITGATGHLGKGTIEFLIKNNVKANHISALVRDENKAADLKAMGVNIVVGDYNDYQSLINAFSGVDKLLFVSGSDLANRSVQHKNVVDAAKAAGVGHVIYTSVLSSVPVEKSAIAFVSEAHLKTEDWLKESGVNFTLLKNNLYLDVLPQFVGNVLETGTIYLPAGNGKTAFTLRAEMAEAAAKIIIGSGHEGKSYDLTNIETYTYQDVADGITEVTGKDIKYVSPDQEEFIASLKNAGVPEEMISGFASFAIAQAQDEFSVTGNDLQNLLGRTPTSLKAYLSTIYVDQEK